nr:cyclin-D4-2-like [Ipomoea trifida]
MTMSNKVFGAMMTFYGHLATTSSTRNTQSGSCVRMAQKRLSVPMETVFYAANYLDRFISLNKCQSIAAASGRFLDKQVMGIVVLILVVSTIAFIGSWSSSNYNVNG